MQAYFLCFTYMFSFTHCSVFELRPQNIFVTWFENFQRVLLHFHFSFHMLSIMYLHSVNLNCTCTNPLLAYFNICFVSVGKKLASTIPLRNVHAFPIKSTGRENSFVLCWTRTLSEMTCRCPKQISRKPIRGKAQQPASGNRGCTLERVGNRWRHDSEEKPNRQSTD